MAHRLQLLMAPRCARARCLCAVVRRLNDRTRDELIHALSSTDCTLHPNLYTLAVRFVDEL